MRTGGKSIYMFFIYTAICFCINLEYLSNINSIIFCSLLEGYMLGLITYNLMEPIRSFFSQLLGEGYKFDSNRMKKFIFPRLEIFPDIVSIFRKNNSEEIHDVVLYNAQAQMEDYNIFFEESAFPMLLVDPVNGQCLSVNNAAVELFEFSKTEFMNGDAGTFYCTPDIEHPVNATILDGGIYNHKKKNGQRFCAHAYFKNATFKHHQARLVILIEETEKISLGVKDIPRQELTIQY